MCRQNILGSIKNRGLLSEPDAGADAGLASRLMKQENMFGRLQLGYNPNRERVFLFANLKTSRYDTVASRYQKELKEYQQKTLLKGNNENRAYVSRYWEGASVLIEKRENKPWTRRSVASYLGRENMESLQKTLPFFVKEEEKKALEKRKSRKKELEKQIRQLRLEAGRQEAEEERSSIGNGKRKLKELRREDTRGMYDGKSSGGHSDKEGRVCPDFSPENEFTRTISRKRISKAITGSGKRRLAKYRQRLRATQNARRMRTNERDKDRDIPK